MFAALGETYKDASDLWLQGFYFESGSNFSKGLIEMAGGPLSRQSEYGEIESEVYD